jgi:hypothetical protein
MIEDAHDAGLSMRRHRYRMEPVLMHLLQHLYFTYHLFRQPLGNKV